VKILLIQGTTVVATLTASTPKGSNGTGTFNWAIPAGQAPGNYKIRVKSTTTATILDESNAVFAIT
jgi:hypothetical protein